MHKVKYTIHKGTHQINKVTYSIHPQSYTSDIPTNTQYIQVCIGIHQDTQQTHSVVYIEYVYTYLYKTLGTQNYIPDTAISTSKAINIFMVLKGKFCVPSSYSGYLIAAGKCNIVSPPSSLSPIPTTYPHRAPYVFTCNQSHMTLENRKI